MLRNPEVIAAYLGEAEIVSLLELSSVVVRYGKVEAVRGLSLRVEQGEIVTLLGANGAGKSRPPAHYFRPGQRASGTIHFAGQPIAGLSPEAIVRLGIAHVPEGRRVFPGLTVKENIMLGGSNRRASSSANSRDVGRMFDISRTSALRHALGWTLSGGQLQMVAIARGLMARPKLLLLDEPSLGLAPLIVQQVFKVIRDIRESGTTVLLVEQNANMALRVADRGYVLETGRLALGGDPATLWSDERIRDAYLGGHAKVTA